MGKTRLCFRNLMQLISTRFSGKSNFLPLLLSKNHTPEFVSKTTTSRRSYLNLMERCRPVVGGKNQTEIASAEGKTVVGEEEQKTTSGWKEHTWSTFIARAEEEEVEAPQGKVLLSSFQVDKFVHFFYHVLDVNR